MAMLEIEVSNIVMKSWLFFVFVVQFTEKSATNTVLSL